MNKKTCIVFDIDGVVCDSRDRHLKYIDMAAEMMGDIQKFMKSLDVYSETTDGDKVIAGGKNLLFALVDKFTPDAFFYLTSRGEKGRKPSMTWLEDNGLLPYNCQLIMRPEYRQLADGTYIIPEGRFSDVQYKCKVVKQLMKSYDVIFAVDDRADICEGYARLKVPTLKVSFVDMPYFNETKVT